MTQLAHRLKRKISFVTQIRTITPEGGYERIYAFGGYDFWAEFIPGKYLYSSSVQTDEKTTAKFTVRMGGQYMSNFINAKVYIYMQDIHPISGHIGNRYFKIVNFNHNFERVEFECVEEEQ